MRRQLLVPLLLVLACREPAAARIVVDADPFLLNGPGPVGFPAHVESATGERLGAPAFVATSDADSIASASAAGLRCHRRGDAHITLSIAELSHGFVVQCRPIRSFSPFLAIEAEAGGPLEPIPLMAFDSTGRRVEEVRFSASSRDTTIAVASDGMVQPRALGRSYIHLDFGGLTSRVGVTVIQTLVVDTLALAAGEYRQWPLGTGRFRIGVFRADGRQELTGAALRPVNANCARDRGHRETIHCVVADSALLAVVATRPTRAIVRIVRMPD